MPTTKSKVTQQIEVGDGLALGVLASGIVAVTLNKPSIASFGPDVSEVPPAVSW
ncbi:MAG: hypothetical protein ACR2N4_12700 [Jatrophihabitans sp.]